ncbi:MAG: T9SS type A sorting domain-containing protein, partial [Bacteroides sp.]
GSWCSGVAPGKVYIFKNEKEGAPQPKTYVVTLAKEGEGELKVTGIEESKLNAVPEGTELTAVATPAKGWKLKSLTAGTQDISSDGKFTVTANVEVKAVFEKTTSVEDAVLANVLVAPNPFIAQLRLVCNGATGRYDLLNAQGVVVRSGNMDGNEVLIETSDLTSGLYLLRLTATNGATKVVTVVKE